MSNSHNDQIISQMRHSVEINYAAGITYNHFMLLAEEQGYEIDDEDVDEIREYLDGDALENLAIDAIAEWAEHKAS